MKPKPSSTEESPFPIDRGKWKVLTNITELEFPGERIEKSEKTNAYSDHLPQTRAQQTKRSYFGTATHFS